MKRCPTCTKVLPDDAMLVCPYDGTPLLETQISPNALADTQKDDSSKASLAYPTTLQAAFGKKWLITSIALFVLISGALLAVYIIKLGKSNSSSCSEKVRITAPLDLQHVNIPVMVKGTYQDLPQGQEIWILIYPSDVGKYYPQNHVEYLDDSRWISSASIGLDWDKGKTFYIYAVLADEQAQRVLNDYIEQAKNANDSPGMADLAKGARICYAVTVTRK